MHKLLLFETTLVVGVVLAFKAVLLSDSFYAPLALGDALVAHCYMRCYHRGILRQLGYDELLLYHLDFLVECLEMQVIQLVNVLEEDPN